MKKNTHHILTSLLIIVTFTFTVSGQTPVSGGIYANTTWTQANSPYIVTGNVVVFPGFVLTIEPGVEIRFDNGFSLEIRQAKLIAIGTISDSITFTSNSTSPSAGIYEGMFLNGGNMVSKFSYCNFRYAYYTLKTTVNDTLLLSNSHFSYNGAGVTGVTGLSYPKSAIITDCLFDHHTGDAVNLSNLDFLDVINCQFLYNNSRGVAAFSCNSLLKNCTFSHNQSGADLVNFIMDSCDFLYNNNGYSGTGGLITHCNFDFNSNVGAYSLSDSVSECHMGYNKIGIKTSTGVFFNNVIEYNTEAGISPIPSWVGGHVFSHNVIQNNRVGFDNVGIPIITHNSIINNDTGIILNSNTSNISCNVICNNDINLAYISNINYSVPYNYWCTMDSSIIETKIYDGYDNVSYGLVTFMPLDTTGCNLVITDIPDDKKMNFSFKVYPNPVSDLLTLTVPEKNSKYELRIYNVVGELQSSFLSNTKNTFIDVKELPKGMYIIEVSSAKDINRLKFIKK